MAITALNKQPIKIPTRQKAQPSWLQRFQISWQSASPLKKTCGYGVLTLTATYLYLQTIPFLIQQGHIVVRNGQHVSSEDSWLITICITPIVEELFYRGFVGNLIHTIQGIVHQRIYPVQLPTRKQSEFQTTLRVNLQSALFVATHLDDTVMDMSLRYIQQGRATGYLFETQGLPQAIFCHAGHNLLSYTGHSLIKAGLPPILVNHRLYYLVVFWGVLKKPILPLPSPLRQKCDAVYNTITGTLSAACQKGWRCFRRIFRC